MLARQVLEGNCNVKSRSLFNGKLTSFAQPPDFLSNPRLKLDRDLKNARLQPPLAPYELGPAKRVPPAEHVSHAIVVGGSGERVFSRHGVRFVEQVFTRDDVQIVADQLCRYASQCQLIAGEGSPGDDGQLVIEGLLWAMVATATVPVVIFLETHGKVIDGAFNFKLATAREVPGSVLFKAIGAQRKAPVQLFLTACHG